MHIHVRDLVQQQFEYAVVSLDIKVPAERATPVTEYVTAMKTVKQRNMVNREMKLAIVDELQTLFHPIVNSTKQSAEETRKELAPVKKMLTDIDGALTAQPVESRPPSSKNTDITFGFYRKKGQLRIGNKTVQIDKNKRTSTVGDTEYTSGLEELIISKQPHHDLYSDNGYQAYIDRCTDVREF